MTETLPKKVRNEIIRKLILEENYRTEVVNIIDSQFLLQAIEFLKNVQKAKYNDHDDWYEENLISKTTNIDHIAWNSGLGKKTISNTYGTATKDKVLEVSKKHFKEITEIVNEMKKDFAPISLSLDIGIGEDKISLDNTETVLIINALAARKAGIRGGAWSTVGKQVEKPLMKTLCKLLRMSEEYYDEKRAKEEMKSEVREIDFFLFVKDEKHRCEVKLMGKGNPESADVVDYRKTKVLVADKLSDTNKQQLNQKKVLWIAMNDGNILEQFSKVLEKLKIPHTPFKGDLKESLNQVLERI